MGIVLDTSIIIASEKGKFDLPGFLFSRADEKTVMAAVTASELIHGYKRGKKEETISKRKDFIEGVLSTIPTASFGLVEARIHADIWANLAGKGQIIGPYDLLIASTAISLGFALATLNQKEFMRIHDLQLLDVSKFMISTPP